MHYDNRADPAASNRQEYAGWNTRFNTIGARWEPVDPLTLTAQYIEGRTAVGPNGDLDQFLMDLSAWYALASVEVGYSRLSVRYDRFSTRQTSGNYGPPSDDAGHALTVAVMHRLAEQWELAAEWLRVDSDFPPRYGLGLPPAARDTQIQLAVRYRFRWQTG